jgi:hypothetical protein
MLLILFIMFKLNSIILIIKPTRCTNFSNLFLEWNSTCFRHFLCPSSVFQCTHSNGIRHTGLRTACSQAVSTPVWHIPLLCVHWKTPDDGQRKCLKHVEFHSKNEFEKLVHLVGFIIRNLARCTVTWTSKLTASVIYFNTSIILILEGDKSWSIRSNVQAHPLFWGLYGLVKKHLEVINFTSSYDNILSLK